MTNSIGRCPDCGKVISFHFPIHDCKPTPNKLREIAEAKKRPSSDRRK